MLRTLGYFPADMYIDSAVNGGLSVEKEAGAAGCVTDYAFAHAYPGPKRYSDF